MGWIDADFPDDRDPRDINSHFMGILLERVRAGLEYKATVPYMRVRATRNESTDQFLIEFRGDPLSYPGIGRAYIHGGRTLGELEKIIIYVINRPSLLRKHEVRKQLDDYADTIWPDRPDPDAPPNKVNVRALPSGRIFRLVSRDYSIGVWREDLNSEFVILFWRHADSVWERKVARLTAGPSFSEVEETVNKALLDPQNFLKFRWA